jgi:transcriptional regulator with XRE-family HTH domain
MKYPSQSLLKILADNVRFYRRKKGLSQEEFAELCGYHRTYISIIERGKRNVTLMVLENLATALEISVLDLLTEQKHSKDSGDS